MENKVSVSFSTEHSNQLLNFFNKSILKTVKLYPDNYSWIKEMCAFYSYINNEIKKGTTQSVVTLEITSQVKRNLSEIIEANLEEEIRDNEGITLEYISELICLGAGDDKERVVNNSSSSNNEETSNNVDGTNNSAGYGNASGDAIQFFDAYDKFTDSPANEEYTGNDVVDVSEPAWDYR